MNEHSHWKPKVQDLEAAYLAFKETQDVYYERVVKEKLKANSDDWSTFLEQHIEKTKTCQDYKNKFIKPFDECVECFQAHELVESQVKNILQEASSNKTFLYKDPDKIEPLIAMDCEMVGTTIDEMALARLSAVDINGEAIMDMLVKPHEDLSFVKDYRTHVTGLSKKDFESFCLSFNEAQALFCRKMDTNTVIIGHAVHHDLLSLKLRHDRVIDTSFLFPVKKSPTHNEEYFYTHSLEYLSQKILKEQLDREARKGVHDSIEDSVKSLKLVFFLFKAQLQGYRIPELEKRTRYKKKTMYNTSIAYTIQKVQQKEKKTIIKLSKTPQKNPKFTEGYRNYMKAMQGLSSSVSFKKKRGKLTRLKAKCGNLKRFR